MTFLNIKYYGLLYSYEILGLLHTHKKIVHLSIIIIFFFLRELNLTVKRTNDI